MASETESLPTEQNKENSDNKDSEEQKDGEEENDKDKNANFECNICLDTATDAVISICGHLFCWPCLHQWLEVRAHNKTCPVCKAAIDKDKVIPLYGRGRDSSQDPRNKVPPRPAGQRTESPPQSFLGGFPGFGETTFQFQFGAFPFGLFNLVYNNNGYQIPEGHRQEDRFLSNVFAIIAFLFMIWMITL